MAQTAPDLSTSENRSKCGRAIVRKVAHRPMKERAEAVWKRYTGLVERYKTEIAMGPLSLANRVVVRIKSDVSIEDL